MQDTLLSQLSRSHLFTSFAHHRYVVRIGNDRRTEQVEIHRHYRDFLLFYMWTSWFIRHWYFSAQQKKQKTHTLSQLSLGESRIRHVEHKLCTGLNKLIFCCVVCGRTVFSYCCSSCLWKDSLILCCWADTIEFEWHFNFISKMTKENCLHEVATAMSFSCVW